MHWEEAFRMVAGRQFGVIGIDQLRSIGCDWNHWARARRNGRWKALSRRVLVADGTPRDNEQRVLAAVLDAGGGALLHGPTALAWLGLRGYDLRSVHVERDDSQRSGPSDLAIIHRLRDVRPSDRCVVRGVPSMTALRAIWSEASRFATERMHQIGLDRLGRVLDDAHRDGLLTLDDLHRSVRELGQRGRAGTALMRELAEARPVGSSATESRNEDRFEEIVTRSGLPAMQRQIVVGGSKPIGRCDFRDSDLPLIVEVNSLTFHSTVSDRLADEQRYRELNDAGLTVAVIWETDLWSHPSNVETTLRRARSRARDSDRIVIHSAHCPWPDDVGRSIVELRRPPLRG